MFSLFNKIRSVDVNSIDKNLSKINLIDIREPYETNYGTIKGARKIPMGILLENPSKYLNKDDEYYIMCQSGMRSSRASKDLDKLGYKIINVSGGFSSYSGNNIKK